MNPTLTQNITDLFIDQVNQKIGHEFIGKIKYCLSLLTEEEVWYQPNSHCNSVGVMILHLNGNVRQWVLSGACGLADHRDRPAEFYPESQVNKNELIKMMDALANDLDHHLPQIKPENLIACKDVQCYNETVLAMLMHATEHFSYHTGQIIYLTKLLKDMDTGFYADLDLEKTN